MTEPMREKKTRKLPPKGSTKLTTEQIMQRVAKQHARAIEYLKDK